MNKFTLSLLSGVIAIAGVTTIAASAQTIPNFQEQVTNVQTALVAKNLTDWKTASKELSNSRIDATTQEQLDEMSDEYTQRQAVQDAITNNDYAAFQEVADERMLERVTTQEEFDTLVADQQARTEYETQVAETIRNNDFEAFKTLAQNLPEPTEDNGRGMSRANRPELTDEDIQEKFTRLVEAYNATGTLPGDDNFGLGMGGGFGGHKGGFGR